MIRIFLSPAILFLVFSCGLVKLSALESPWGKGYLPNVAVLNQNGEAVSFYDDLIKGKVVVFSFIFTSCRDVCPVVTARLAQVKDNLGDAVGKDVFFVSISIDPTTDTPTKLKGYASAFGAEKGWTFVTGRPEDIHIIRHKLGERSRIIANHSNTILIYNDRTGEWSKDSAFSDLGFLTAHIISMSPSGPKDRENEINASLPEPAPLGHTTEAGLPGQSLFIKTCAACHTVGKGPKVGPDLANIASRRSKQWLVSYLVDPQKMRVEGDPTALELITRYPTVRMPTLSLSENDAADVMSYITALTYATKANESSPPSHRGHNHH